jgi:hypothetical protein
MLDFRYHAISLAAVFFALILGIVIGVGISGRGFVDKSERRNLENRIDRLQARVDDLQEENDGLRGSQEAGQEFMTDAYPVLMDNRLAGKRIAMIVVGTSAGSAGGAVNRALDDAEGTVSRYRAVNLPVAATGVRRALASLPAFRRMADAGHELGQEWVTGGKTPLADALAPVLVEEQRGTGTRPVDGVVVVQAEEPADAATKQFLDGLYSGLGSSGVPVVAVEASRDEPSNVPAFQAYSGFSTVDDIDTTSGRLALALLLGGAQSGDYGVKPTATAPLPKIEPVPGA